MSYVIYFIFAILLIVALWILAPKTSRLELIAKSRRGIDIIEEEVNIRLNKLNENRIKRLLDKEMYEEVGFIRNIAMSGSGEKLSTDLLVEKLIEHDGRLATVLTKTLSLLRMDKRKDAVEYFVHKVETQMSRDFIRIIIEWDDISPNQLSSSLLSYQKSMKEMRMTEQKKQDEMISDVIYFPVVINVLVVFMNFIYVAYFLEQKDMLSTIFF